MIEPDYGKIINKAYNRRTKGDYDIHVVFDKDTVIEMHGEMNKFIFRIKEFLKIDQ